MSLVTEEQVHNAVEAYRESLLDWENAIEEAYLEGLEAGQTPEIAKATAAVACHSLKDDVALKVTELDKIYRSIDLGNVQLHLSDRVADLFARGRGGDDPETK